MYILKLLVFVETGSSHKNKCDIMAMLVFERNDNCLCTVYSNNVLE